MAVGSDLDALLPYAPGAPGISTPSSSISDTLGIYISVPFCRSKCTYCNFASGVYPAALHEGYVDQLCRGIAGARLRAAAWGAILPERVDSVYLGGGTPSLLPPELLLKLGRALRRRFDLAVDAEVTLECAPGQVEDRAWEVMLNFGVNRVSFGVQSFVDREAAATGRLHTRAVALADISRARAEGIARINIDLIAGLPHQTRSSWRQSLDILVEAGAGHASVYMLEVDEDSRLGRELLAGGARYHAAQAPDDEMTAGLYEMAVRHLERSGLRQYEISNFAAPGGESFHNCKYWQRQPYLGFGVDAHSFLRRADGAGLRIASPGSLEECLADPDAAAAQQLTLAEEVEEEWFLGLRLREGVRWSRLARRCAALLAAYGEDPGAHGAVLDRFRPVVDDLAACGLLQSDEDAIRLTPKGILLSNEVFARFLGVFTPPVPPLAREVRRPRNSIRERSSRV